MLFCKSGRLQEVVAQRGSNAESATQSAVYRKSTGNNIRGALSVYRCLTVSKCGVVYQKHVTALYAFFCVYTVHFNLIFEFHSTFSLGTERKNRRKEQMATGEHTLHEQSV